jgi:hypothetical protein
VEKIEGQEHKRKRTTTTTYEHEAASLVLRTCHHSADTKVQMWISITQTEYCQIRSSNIESVCDRENYGCVCLERENLDDEGTAFNIRQRTWRMGLDISEDIVVSGLALSSPNTR